MSFKISKLESVPFLSEEANEYLTSYFSQVITSDEYISKFDVLRNLKIPPYTGPTKMCTALNTFTKLNIRDGDIFVCGMPKSGSSWMQNIVWLLTHGLDYETNRSVDRTALMCNFDDFTKIEPAKENGNGFPSKDNRYEQFESMKSPRVAKSHCPVHLLPTGIWSKQAKIIYIVRNPKDSAVSEYHFRRNAFHVNLTMDDMVNAVTNDKWLFSPRIGHILNFWRLRHLPNVHFVAYEDLVTDPHANIKLVSEFLGCNYTDEQLKELAEYSSFDNMKKIRTINRENDVIQMEERFGKKRPDPEFKFLRKGKAGAYRDELNENQIQKLDDWIGKYLKDTDFKFKM